MGSLSDVKNGTPCTKTNGAMEIDILFVSHSGLKCNEKAKSQKNRSPVDYKYSQKAKRRETSKIRFVSGLQMRRRCQSGLKHRQSITMRAIYKKKRGRLSELIQTLGRRVGFRALWLVRHAKKAGTRPTDILFVLPLFPKWGPEAKRRQRRKSAYPAVANVSIGRKRI